MLTWFVFVTYLVLYIFCSQCLYRRFERFDCSYSSLLSSVCYMMILEGSWIICLLFGKGLFADIWHRFRTTRVNETSVRAFLIKSSSFSNVHLHLFEDSQIFIFLEKGVFADKLHRFCITRVNEISDLLNLLHALIVFFIQ